MTDYISMNNAVRQAADVLRYVARHMEAELPPDTIVVLSLGVGKSGEERLDITVLHKSKTAGISGLGYARQYLATLDMQEAMDWCREKCGGPSEVKTGVEGGTAAGGGAAEAGEGPVVGDAG